MWEEIELACGAGSVFCLSPLITRVEANEPDRLVTSPTGNLRRNKEKKTRTKTERKKNPSKKQVSLQPAIYFVHLSEGDLNIYLVSIVL